MGPFDVNPDWYVKYWYSQEPVKPPSWRVPTAGVSMVVIMIVAMFI
jgi:hypothetical protein